MQRLGNQHNFVQVNIESNLGKYKPVGFTIEDNGCWLWVGSRNYKGYGILGHKKAHRAMYEQFIGAIPDGLVMDHFVCDNPPCVNPYHVRPVTSRENTLRSDKTLAAQQLKQTHCRHGHPLVPGNLRKNRNEPRKRRCLICKRLSWRKAYYAKKWGPA